MANLNERAKQILSNYPTADAVHFTSDGSPFITEGSAKNHARTLEDKTITPVTRAEAYAESAPAAPGVEKTDAVKPLSKMNKVELLAEAAKRNLTVAENLTKAELVSAIEEADRVAALEITPALNETEGTTGVDAAPVVTE